MAMVHAMVLLLAMIWHPLLPYRLGPPRSNPHFAPSQPASCHWFKAQSYSYVPLPVISTYNPIYRMYNPIYNQL